ncbi:hypothetical protein AAKU55_000945 [Oxalobacteraceae bacterium GrIS 1.11]
MPEELYEYCRHAIRIHLTEDEDGRWTSSYAIDGADCHQEPGKPKPTRGQALALARAAAQRHVDSFKTQAKT